MTVTEQIAEYFDSLNEAKRADLLVLHELCLNAHPGCRLWYLDGKDASGKTVSNPNVGYGRRVQRYADGTSKEFYQVGLSANTGGISVYLLGLERTYLSRTYGAHLGKATVTGYCLKFKRLSDIDPEVLALAIRDAFEQTGEGE